MKPLKRSKKYFLNIYNMLNKEKISNDIEMLHCQMYEVNKILTNIENEKNYFLDVRDIIHIRIEEILNNNKQNGKN